MKVHGDAAGFGPTESSKAAVYVRASSVCLQLGKETAQYTRDGGGWVCKAGVRISQQYEDFKTLC